VEGCFAPSFVEREWGRAPQHDWVVETRQTIEDSLATMSDPQQDYR
jgi:hypothetical protein